MQCVRPAALSIERQEASEVAKFFHRAGLAEAGIGHDHFQFRSADWKSDDTSTNSGAAYIFVRNAGIWTQQAYLKALNTGAGDALGFAVGVSGSTVVVGAYLKDSNATGVNGAQTNNAANAAGAAYVFSDLTPANPVLPPTIRAELPGSGQFRLQFNSSPGSSFIVLVSTNLADWTMLPRLASPSSPLLENRLGLIGRSNPARQIWKSFTWGRFNPFARSA